MVDIYRRTRGLARDGCCWVVGIEKALPRGMTDKRNKATKNGRGVLGYLIMMMRGNYGTTFPEAAMNELCQKEQIDGVVMCGGEKRNSKRICSVWFM